MSQTKLEKIDVKKRALRRHHNLRIIARRVRILQEYGDHDFMNRLTEPLTEKQLISYSWNGIGGTPSGDIWTTGMLRSNMQFITRYWRYRYWNRCGIRSERYDAKRYCDFMARNYEQDIPPIFKSYKVIRW